MFLKLNVDLTKGNPASDPNPKNDKDLSNFRGSIQTVLVEARKRTFDEVSEISILVWEQNG